MVMMTEIVLDTHIHTGDYGEDTRFNEDGSLIGQYGREKSSFI